MPYEIHLIDSPGFDDDLSADAEVLSSIADYVNLNSRLKQRLAGVLYLHDITKAKVGGAGTRNIRMLEKMIGLEKFSNCTIVTTKWGCTNSSQDEAQREETLRADPEFFGSMLQEGQPHPEATMRRFDPKSQATALDIIKPYLKNKFTLHISKQMADPKGPKLPLGETDAGKVVADNLTKLVNAKLELEKAQAAQDLLSQRFDETLSEELKLKRKELRRRIRLQRTGRWIMRTTIVGGAIVATVLTMGPGASAFVLAPTFERAVRGQRRNEKRAMVELEEEFKKRKQNPNFQKLQDLDDAIYCNGSGSSETLFSVIKRGETVGFAGERGEDGKGNMMIGKDMGSDFESTSEEDESDMSD